jgi:hypothetical protein
LNTATKDFKVFGEPQLIILQVHNVSLNVKGK